MTYRIDFEAMCCGDLSSEPFKQRLTELIVRNAKGGKAMQSVLDIWRQEDRPKQWFMNLRAAHSAAKIFVKAAVCLALAAVPAWSEYRPAVLVLPFHPGKGISSGERRVGLGIQALMENMLAAEGSLEETWAGDKYTRIFSSADDLSKWLFNAEKGIPSLERVSSRYVASGTVDIDADQIFVTLVLLDRQTGKRFTRRTALDLPQLVDARREFLDLLRTAGVSHKAGDATLLWKEDLTRQCLASLGAGIYEADVQLWAKDARSVPAAVAMAASQCPSSYVAQATLAWLQTDALAEGNGADAGTAAMQLNGEGVRAFEWLLEAAVGALSPDLAKRGADGVMAVRGGDSLFDKARFHCWVGQIEFIRGDLDEAEQSFRESIRQNPQALDPYLHLAKVMHRRNRLVAEGEDALAGAKKSFPDPEDQKRIDATDEVFFYVAMGDVFFVSGIEADSKGEGEEAEKAFRSAAKIHTAREPWDAVADLISLAELEEAQGEAEQAKADRAEAERIVKMLDGSRWVANALSYRAMHILRAGNFAKAQPALDEALHYCHLSKDVKCEWEILNYAGLRYVEQGYVNEGLEKLQDAVQVQDALKDDKVAGIAHNNLGIAYRSAGDLQQALESFNQAYKERIKGGDEDGARRTLMSLGTLYGDLGKYEEGMNEIQEVLRLARNAADKDTEATALYTLGSYLIEVGKPNQAIKPLQDAVRISRDIKAREAEGISLNNLAVAKSEAGELAEGQTLLEQSLEVARSQKNWSDECLRLANFGALLFNQGKHAEGEHYLQHALALATARRDKVEQARVLARLMLMTLDRPRLALWYGKRAAETMANLGPALYLERGAQAEAFGNFFNELVDLLVREGALAEAREVLDVRKISEQARVVKQDEATLQRKVSLLQPAEKTAEQEYDELCAAWFRLEQERTDPTAKRTKETVTEETHKSQQKLDDYVERITKEFSQPIPNRPRITTAINPGLENLNGKALIQALPGDHLRLIVTTEHGSKLVEGGIEIGLLNQKVWAFWQTLLDPRLDPVPLAKDLYNAVFLPIQPQINEAHVSTLLWSVSGTLRYLPFAALHDGESYLVTRYRNILYNPIGQPGTAAPAGKILAAGVTRPFPDFPALPYVCDELHAIVHTDAPPTTTSPCEVSASESGNLPGVMLMDAEFTWKELQTQLASQYPLVHLATHFRFRAENPRRSELLLGDGTRLRLDELQSRGNLFQGVALVVLSGCDTGSPGSGSDQNQIDALSGAVLNLGARSVVASLWPVSDRSTAHLMANFYRALLKEADAAKALQETQIQMLQEDRTHAHPYYWAPFFLTAKD
jgi:CHAT domain-containing protein/tetratricopeptide (TPR) repeat protein